MELLLILLNILNNWCDDDASEKVNELGPKENNQKQYVLSSGDHEPLNQIWNQSVLLFLNSFSLDQTHPFSSKN